MKNHLDFCKILSEEIIRNYCYIVKRENADLRYK